jgi:hypothetical protein
MLLLGRFINFDPTRAPGLATLTAPPNEAGRSYLQRVSGHQPIMLAWVIAGLVLITWMSARNP